MTISLVTAPAAEPVTTAEAKLQCAIVHSVHDSMIERIIKAARARAEHHTGRAFIQQTWSLQLGKFADRIDAGSRTAPGIWLPKGRTISVDSVAYKDADGDAQTLTVNVGYRIIPGGAHGHTLEAIDAWPGTAYGRADAVLVTFKAGYGTAATDVPEDLRHAILMDVAHLYANREAILPNMIRQEMQVVPMGWKELLDPYVLPRL